MIPPRRRRTKWRVDSYCAKKAQSESDPFIARSLAPTNLLDVVVGESTAVLQLLASKDKTLLVRGNSLLVLNLGLHIVDRVRGLDLQGDGLASQSLHEAASRSD